MKWRPFSSLISQQTVSSDALVLRNVSIGTLRNSAEHLRATCPGCTLLIDSGSPATLIPRAVATFLNLGTIATTKQISLIESDHTTTKSYPCVYVWIEHEDIGSIGPITAACCPKRDYVLFGRDSLGELLLILDGEKKRFCIQKRRWIHSLFFNMFGRQSTGAQ